MRASPVARPQSDTAYQALTASEVDSWLRASPKRNRPLAQECPTYQSMCRWRG